MKQETVFDFVKDPTKENFLRSRELIITNPDYDPYSDDLDIMEKLFEDKEYDKLNYYVTINVLLSPRAHFIKYFSLKQIGNTKAAEGILFICHNILSCIEKTGDGALQNPYIVTRVSDEKDFLELHLRKKYTQQRLMQHEGKYLDVLTLEDGSEIYFDITVPYQRISFSREKKEMN
ncbi:DUF4919 domain-containing protein [Chryseobacterium sp. RG1]|uniref:DUF4919 domain-containing protein n=1 Tax=Chryseobacterium tagetis TaxID=2801334 RepID=A0ABS8A5Q5_9FLAO|nr:DUF4919 domain-containing protein [Chryseobacterium tagetis]MCA6068663.1 DUF4919 domain-containing protein [Chryseobacterium tagetis]